MAEYIEREAVRSAVKSKTMTKYDWSEEIDFEDFEKVLDAVPAADVAPVRHGRWVFGGDGCVVCSECDEEEPNDNHRNYCHNCGARMDGE